MKRKFKFTIILSTILVTSLLLVNNINHKKEVQNSSLNNKSHIAVMVGDTVQSNFPKKGEGTFESITCDNGSTGTWDNEAWTLNLSSVTSDNCVVKFKAVPKLSEYIINNTEIVTSGQGLYHHTSSLAQGAGDDSYRYAGANPSNYACFGSDANPCPEDNQYRIIAVYGDQVKLMKTKDINTGNTLTWDDNNKNDWTKATLNTYLNGTFLATLGDNQNLIETTTWKVGGNTYANISQSIPSVTYQNEIVSPAVPTTHSAKIGLIYANEYGFAATQNHWGTTLYNYDGGAKNDDWLFHSNKWYWTITRVSDFSGAFTVNNRGYLNYDFTNSSNGGVFPVFYLTSTVQYKGGDGTFGNPYIIK